MQSSHGMKDGIPLWSYITAIPQQLSFEPRYVLQVGLTSPMKLVSILYFPCNCGYKGE